MATVTLAVPDIGGAEGAEVVEVLVVPGDTVEVEQSLIVLESDKASMEIPATSAGTVLEIKVAVGDELAEGDAIVTLETSDAAATDSPAPAEAPEPATASNSETPSPVPAAEPPQVAAQQAVTTQVVRIPDIGTDGEVDLVEIIVEPGQQVAEGDSLVILESDKASMEVPAPVAGAVVKLLVESGATVSEGTPILELEVNADSANDTPTAPAPESAPIASESATSNPSVPESTTPPTVNTGAITAPPVGDAGSADGSDASADVYAGPAVRKLAREFGVVLAKVSGSGPRGRILKEDLHRFVASALAKEGGGGQPSSGAGIPAIPEVNFAEFGDVEPSTRTRLDKVTAANMSRAWLNVPHVTQFDDADITDLEAFRAGMKAEAERRGTKITPLPFILKACAAALNANPIMKSSLADAGETLVNKQYCHIGMAVDTPAGLVVPVIRDVDRKTVWELSAEVLELAALAKQRKLRPDQMKGSVFSVSSLGNIGGRGFTPIVNAPEVAILGVSRASIQPVWNGKDFEPRKLLPVSLSYDHRVVNGGDAGRFLTDLVALLSDIRRILL